MGPKGLSPDQRRARRRKAMVAQGFRATVCRLCLTNIRHGVCSPGICCCVCTNDRTMSAKGKHPAPKMAKVQSSMVTHVGYHDQSQTLHVTFAGGKTYRYHGVSPELHKDLMAAPSTGKFINEHVRDKFTHSTD